MKPENRIALYQSLRDKPMWRLLAADHGPVIVGLLQAHLMEGARSLSASVFYERLERDLEALRGAGHELPRTAQAYVANWLAEGYLIRRFPEGATEEEYEVTAAAAEAIRYVSGLAQPRISATESRLAVVIDQLARLADETETDPAVRVAALKAERDRIDREIAAIEEGRLRALPADRAVERVREIISLAEDLSADFRRVRDQFEALNRDLRERIMDNEGSRGEVLDALFAGVDVIAESDAGRTFHAFWRLLTDQEQNATLDGAVDRVLGRDFVDAIGYSERRFLIRLVNTLLDEGGRVHEVLQHFARSLKQFVQSREYLEQRRLNQLLRDAQRAALDLKDRVKTSESLPYDLKLTTSRISSLAQWSLFDPSLNTVEGGMESGLAAAATLDELSRMVTESEIDFRRLKLNIREALAERGQASIGEIVATHPPHQGLGSIVGYVALGSRHGERGGELETVEWHSGGVQRAARIPVIYFLKDRLHELG